MLLLYERLEIPLNATRDKIERNFKILLYKYRALQMDDKVYQITLAYNTLSNTYLKNLYDIFGDSVLNVLESSSISYVVSRLLTRLNLLFFFISGVLLIINTAGFVFIRIFTDSAVVRSVFFPVSAVLLFIPTITVFLSVHKHQHHLSLYYLIYFLYIALSSSVLIIACLMDDLISVKNGFIVFQFIHVFVFLLLLSHNVSREDIIYYTIIYGLLCLFFWKVETYSDLLRISIATVIACRVSFYLAPFVFLFTCAYLLLMHKISILEPFSSLHLISLALGAVYTAVALYVWVSVFERLFFKANRYVNEKTSILVFPVYRDYEEEKEDKKEKKEAKEDKKEKKETKENK